MKLKFASLFILLLGMAEARAQFAPQPQWIVGLGYDYVHSNLRPGCNCFSLNGGTASLIKPLTPHLALEGAFQGVHSGNVSTTGKTLTLYSYLVGPRYQRPASRRVLPFGHLLVGASHASGNLYGSPGTPSESGYAFASLIGGGVELPVSTHFLIRPLQADYLLTLLPNGNNDRQNNFNLNTGIVLRFGGAMQRRLPRQ